MGVSQPPSKEPRNEPNGLLLASWVGADWLPTSNRFHARENNFLGRTCMCWTPFSSSGQFGDWRDGGGHVLRTNTLLLCRVVHKRLSFVVIWLARPKILDGLKHDFFLPRNETNGHEQPRSVPSGSARSNRVKTRHPPFFGGSYLVAYIGWKGESSPHIFRIFFGCRHKLLTETR